MWAFPSRNRITAVPGATPETGMLVAATPSVHRQRRKARSRTRKLATVENFPFFSPVHEELTALPDDGRIAVVGEFHCQQALRIVARKKIAGHDFAQHLPAIVVLVPEPGNTWDRNAVRVDVLLGNRSVKVGYLPGPQAARYQPELLLLQRSGRLGTCPARITGGGDRHYGIYLHLAPARQLRSASHSDHPVIASRTGTDVLLRNDWTCTVTKEEDHQGVLGQYAPADGQEFRNITVSLGFCEIGSGRHRGETAIEVRLDHRRIGQLTRAMSERYGSVVGELLGRGLQVTCAAFTVNTPKGVQVELRMPADPRRAGRLRAE